MAWYAAAPGSRMRSHGVRAKLSEATARRTVRSYQRAKPSRLVQQATGRFQARPFVRNDTWLVAVSYQPSDQPSDGADPSAASPA